MCTALRHFNWLNEAMRISQKIERFHVNFLVNVFHSTLKAVKRNLISVILLLVGYLRLC